MKTWIVTSLGWGHYSREEAIWGNTVHGWFIFISPDSKSACISTNHKPALQLAVTWLDERWAIFGQMLVNVLFEFCFKILKTLLLSLNDTLSKLASVHWYKEEHTQNASFFPLEMHLLVACEEGLIIRLEQKKQWE